MAELSIITKNLSFGYNGERVLSGINLTIKPGDFIGVIGPNGSGKSTLLGLLTGLLNPTEGQVFLNDADIKTCSRTTIASHIGLVPQSAQLNHGLTVNETILSGRFALMGGRIFENEIDIQAAEKAMRATGLTDKAERLSGSLSGGECQRLCIARALAGEPDFLLLDEPTSALDLDHQLKIMNMLERTCRENGAAVCIVSHDLNLASLFCNELLLIKDGSPLAFGPPETALTRDTILQAYNVKTIIDREPSRGRPRVTLIPQQ